MLIPKAKWVLTSLLALILLLGVVFFYLFSEKPVEEIQTSEDILPAESEKIIIGNSVEGRDIEAYTFGNGEIHLLFVGGIHGGYEWNSVLLSYELIKYLRDNPSLISSTQKVTVIPSLNPDGVVEVIGKEGWFTKADVPIATDTSGIGRFNARDVDLNRNFDCKWEPESTWRGKEVSAGTEAFSEPESKALRTFIQTEKPSLAVFFHSQAGAVYASECKNGILPETLTLMNLYADASLYRAVESFDAYPITGDVEGWLASVGIPAITVELNTHESIDWDENISGIQALLQNYR